MNLPFIIIGFSLLCYFSLKKTGFYRNEYHNMSFGSKTLLVLFFICFLGTTLCSFGSRGSEAYSLMIYPLIGSLLFGVPFILIYKKDEMTTSDRIFAAITVMAASLVHYSMYLFLIIAASFGGASKTSRGTGSGSYSGSSGMSGDFDAQMQQSAQQYNEAREQNAREQEERQARSMGANSADEAKELGFL